MKRRNWVCRLMALTICAALGLGSAAMAAEQEPTQQEPTQAEPTQEEPVPEEPTKEEPKLPSSVRVWGTLTKLEGGGLYLENSNPEDPYQTIILHVGEATRILDAVSGQPFALDELKDGDTVYAYTSPMMALSLPPQSTAILILGKIPADFRAPVYCQITAAQLSEGGRGATLTTDGGETLTVTEETEVVPYLTKNVVGPADLVPGARILAWSGMEDELTRVMLFPYTYRGYLTVEGETVYVSGWKLEGAQAVPDETGRPMLPLWQMGEAMGLAVIWDEGSRTISVSDGAETLFRYTLGADLAVTDRGELGLSAPGILREGRLYLAAEDLAVLLNLAY